MWGRDLGVRVGLAKEPTPLPKKLAVAHRARLDVPASILEAVTGWIGRARRLPGMRPWQRAATVQAQVVLVLRWLRDRADLHNLARDARISDATAYRYLHEGLQAIAAHAPDLHDVLNAARAAGGAYLCLDGTLIPTDRVAARAQARHDLWYSGKHRGRCLRLSCFPRTATGPHRRLTVSRPNTADVPHWYEARASTGFSAGQRPHAE